MSCTIFPSLFSQYLDIFVESSLFLSSLVFSLSLLVSSLHPHNSFLKSHLNMFILQWDWDRNDVPVCCSIFYSICHSLSFLISMRVSNSMHITQSLNPVFIYTFISKCTFSLNSTHTTILSNLQPECIPASEHANMMSEKTFVCLVLFVGFLLLYFLFWRLSVFLSHTHKDTLGNKVKLKKNPRLLKQKRQTTIVHCIASVFYRLRVKLLLLLWDGGVG